MARKFLYAVAVLLVLIIAAAFALRLWGYELAATAFVPSEKFVEQEALAANAYRDPAMWLSHPSLARGSDPARWQPEGAERTAGDTPEFAVFFVHPTSYLERAHWNAPLDDAQSRTRARTFLRGLASAFSGSNDVVVLDSGSTDRTVEIARAAGARTVTHPFENFGAQRNHAQTAIPFRHPWVFHLDADELFTPALVKECLAKSSEDPPEIDGYWVAPKMLFRGKWIPHCTDFPAYQARFVHAERFRFIQVGHGQREAPAMRMAKLSASYLHDLSADTETALLEKHRRYARQEAAQYLRRDGQSGTAPGSLFSGDPLSRRRALKAFSHRLPARGLLRFFYQYFLRAGCLDGRPGWSYCLLLARYEHWVSEEIRRQKRLSEQT